MKRVNVFGAWSLVLTITLMFSLVSCFDLDKSEDPIPDLRLEQKDPPPPPPRGKGKKKDCHKDEEDSDTTEETEETVVEETV